MKNAGQGLCAWTYAIAVATLAWTALGGGPDETRAILKVTRLAVSKSGEERFDLFGYRTRDYQRTIGIGIEVRGVGKPGPGRVEWFFVARETQSDVLWCYDQGAEDVWLDPGKPVTLQRTSRELKTTTSQRWGAVHEAGHRPEGYVVRVLAAGQPVALAASSRSLEAVARDPKRWAALLAAGEVFLKPTPAPDGGSEGQGREGKAPRERIDPTTNRPPGTLPTRD